MEYVCDCQPNSVFHCGEAFQAINLCMIFHRLIFTCGFQSLRFGERRGLGGNSILVIIILSC